MIVGIADERGRVGLGEAAPLPGLSRETLAEVQASLQAALAPGGPILGQRLRRPEEISALLAPLALPPSARHALDQALLELLSQHRGVSVAWLLNPGARARVPLHALAATPEEAVRAAGKGARAIKVKVAFGPIDQDQARLSAIREAIGPDLLLRLDANGGWSEDAAIEAIRRFASLGVQCVEQPVLELEAMARVRAAVETPIAADESLSCLEDLEAIVATGAADAVVIKPMMVGGPTFAHALASRAARAGLPVSITTSLESAIGRSAALHVAAAAPGILWTCGLETGHLLAADLVPSDGEDLVEEVRSLSRRARAEPAERGGRARLTWRARTGDLAQLGDSAA